MKIKAGQAMFATLDFVIEMAAKQMVFHEFMVTYLLDNDVEASKEVLKQIKERADGNIDLLRAKLFQYSEIDIDDLMNGDFDF